MRYIDKVLQAYSTIYFSTTPVLLWLSLSRNICSLFYLQCSCSNTSLGLLSFNIFDYIIGLIITKTLVAESFRTDLADHCSTEITNSLLYLVLTSEFWEIQEMRLLSWSRKADCVILHPENTGCILFSLVFCI